MKNYYSLQICLEPNLEKFDLISQLLDVRPTLGENNKLLQTPSLWVLEVEEREEDPYYDFINHFLDLLEGKYEQLSCIGIEKEDITIWRLYEYDQQCNMEYDPKELKRLGDTGIKFCISCWQSSNDEKE